MPHLGDSSDSGCFYATLVADRTSEVWNDFLLKCSKKPQVATTSGYPAPNGKLSSENLDCPSQ